MKHTLLVIILLMLSGCDNSVERAPINMKKGDTYFAAKEYEVAQYYYEKIPEESPLFKEAETKLQQINDLEASMLPKAPGVEELAKVTIFDQSMTKSEDGLNPVNSVELNNESTHKLTSVILEFTYYDGGGEVVGVKQYKLTTSMIGKTQETFSGITPGKLDLACAKCSVRILSAEFQ